MTRILLFTFLAVLCLGWMPVMAVGFMGPDDPNGWVELAKRVGITWGMFICALVFVHKGSV